MPEALKTTGRPDGVDHAKLERSLRAHVSQHDFPCVGAKSALATGKLNIVTGWSLTSAWDDVAIHHQLLDWSQQYLRDPGGLRSLAVVFSGPVDLDEAAFEKAMWERLQSLTDKDGWRGQPYNPDVSSDPGDPHFSLSFGTQAYFVVGLHPNASRQARRAPYPTLVFNLHDQFERLREEQKYERMRKTILKRDEQLDGSINPMLARHGEASEARQYSGRKVDADWQCPFSDPRTR
ncbi:YqcI/YcgG family protein [Erythrobacter arachoides]|uniref:YqcI/YcgG family protein n=1 Tax=Aurantiacibacter arachoides TaxID=1850444 RepID=A0A845A363_9SPHN|nr:guanitoxin biosynthesis heme-dependent pre-guanitoxin N-hydroxylase GntA [Aurantiacibacter arachoides]MXO94368.1 YqcI/YcgG family protein [Aurantiacibacter arachoides]